MTNSTTKDKINSYDYDTPNYTTGEYFTTTTANALRRCYIDIEGAPQTEKIIHLNIEDCVDTKEKNYDAYLQDDSEKIMTRIISINEDEVIAEFYFPNGEIQKKLNEYYVDILKKKNLLFEDSQFNISYTPNEDGMIIKIEPMTLNDDKDVNEFYNQLFSDLGHKC